MDAKRQLRAETLAGEAWIFSALAGAVGVIRRMLLRITARASHQTYFPRFPSIDGYVRRWPDDLKPWKLRTGIRRSGSHVALRSELSWGNCCTPYAQP